MQASAAEVARAARITTARYLLIESGDESADFNEALRLAFVFGVSASDLLCKERIEVGR